MKARITSQPDPQPSAARCSKRAAANGIRFSGFSRAPTEQPRASDRSSRKTGAASSRQVICFLIPVLLSRRSGASPGQPSMRPLPVRRYPVQTDCDASSNESITLASHLPDKARKRTARGAINGEYGRLAVTQKVDNLRRSGALARSICKTRLTACNSALYEDWSSPATAIRLFRPGRKNGSSHSMSAARVTAVGGTYQQQEVEPPLQEQQRAAPPPCSEASSRTHGWQHR